MAITVDWGTGVINVPKLDLTLIQNTPTEIRELDINSFRLTLKDLEDDEAGISFPKTHNHNTSVTVGGVQLARVVEILSPYTVTFEDGQYAVNLVGANSNVGDRVNVNQVSVRSGNSAGLVQTREIEYASFNGGVYIDTTSSNSGTNYPNGTALQPVNNVSDAILIAGVRGLIKLYIIGNITFDTGDNISNFIIEGESHIKTTITMNSGALAYGVEIYNATIQGTLDGNTIIDNCYIRNLNYIEGQVKNSVLEGNITLTGIEAYFINCWSGLPDIAAMPSIDMSGGSTNVNIKEHSGNLKLTNSSLNNLVRIDLVSGNVELDSTITAGSIIIRGVGTFTDNSTGTVIDSAALINNTSVASTTLDETVINHSSAGSVGEALSLLSSIQLQTSKLPDGVKKNTALNYFTFQMKDILSPSEGKVGLSVQALKSIDGATFVSCDNSPTELSYGVYVINLTANDLNGDSITLRFSSAGAIDYIVTIFTQV